MPITGVSRGLTDRLCCLHYRGFLILKPSKETLHSYLLEHLSKTHTWNWCHTLIPLLTISYLEVNIKRTAVRTLFNPTSTLKADNKKSSEVLRRLIYSSQVFGHCLVSSISPNSSSIYFCNEDFLSRRQDIFLTFTTIKVNKQMTQILSPDCNEALYTEAGDFVTTDNS